MTTDSTADYIAVTRLQADYADTVSRRAWPEFHRIFAPDALVVVDTGVGEPLRLHGPDGVSGFISGAIERFEFFQFVPLNTVVETSVGGDPDAAEGRLYICELRQDRESGRWTNAFGVYHDQYRRAAAGGASCTAATSPWPARPAVPRCSRSRITWRLGRSPRQGTDGTSALDSGASALHDPSDRRHVGRTRARTNTRAKTAGPRHVTAKRR
ncbi:nuclear transport factor 2 family protein [Yinghuangia aomiensis]